MKTGTRELYLERVPSPIGALIAVSDDKHLRSLAFEESEGRVLARLNRYCSGAALRERSGPVAVRERLERYLAGELSAIDDIPVAGDGTPFEHAVWDILRTIPVGTTMTYGSVAVALGYSVSASRAVGLANGSNPIPIVVPCHRVIGAKGNLTGFGGGMHRKRWLLHHEGVLLVGT